MATSNNMASLFMAVAVILMISGILGVIKPEISWKWRFGKWIDGDVRPSQAFLRRARIGATVGIIISIVLFGASIYLYLEG